MRLESKGNTAVVHVVLSRRNLLTLLHKLDVPGSERTIMSYAVVGTALWVSAEDDIAHYTERKPGRMTEDTEEYIREHTPEGRS